MADYCSRYISSIFHTRLSECGVAAVLYSMAVCLFALSAGQVHTVQAPRQGASAEHSACDAVGDSGAYRGGVAYHTADGGAVWRVYQVDDAVSARLPTAAV